MGPTPTIGQLTNRAVREVTQTGIGCWTLEPAYRYEVDMFVDSRRVQKNAIGPRGAIWSPPRTERRLEEINATARLRMRSTANGETPWPIFLVGDAGSGKTCAALCLADVYGLGVYSTLSDLHKLTYDDGWRNRIIGHGAGVADVWDGWAMANVAILDEVGERTECTDALYDTLKRALDLRLNYKRALVVITNEDPRRLVDIYDERIASRLLGGTVIKCEGDRRLLR